MSDCEKILALDIGSTNTHIGIVDTAHLTCSPRNTIPSAEISIQLPPLIKGLGNIPAVIAGGRQGRAKEAENVLQLAGNGDIDHFQYHERLPLHVDYDNPEQLGADRIADALYAIKRFHGQECIIIDSGTAITIDSITAESVLSGGAILAGIPAQLAGLAATTGVLPKLPIPAAGVPSRGGSTVECIHAGTVHGTAGALNRIVNTYRSFLKGDGVILATGGGWKITAELVDFPFIFVPDMTIIGTALYRCSSNFFIT